MSLPPVVLVLYALSSGPTPFWIDAEKFYEQTGSARAGSIIEFAAGGKGLGSGWGGKKGDAVEFRFVTPRTLRGATLWIRYARRMKTAGEYELFLDGEAKRRVTFQPTDGWGHLADREWRFVPVPLETLNKGPHSLRLVSAEDENNTNLDGFLLAEGAVKPPSTRREIETCVTLPVRQRRPRTPDEACIDRNMQFEEVDGLRTDQYYPSRESEERATIRLPGLETVDADSAVLSIGAAKHRLEIGETADGWTLLEALSKPRPIAVLARVFDHWGLIVYLAKDGPVAQIRMPVGRLECIREPDSRFPADYFTRLIESQTDILGNRVLEKHGEPSYENMLGFLAPLQAYTFLGAPKSKMKRIVQPTGAIGVLPNRWGGDKPLAETLLDPRDVLLRKANSKDSAAPPFDELRLQAKRGLPGGHLPAIHFGFFDPESSYGFRWEALMEPGTSGTVYTRLADTSGGVWYHRIGSGAGKVEPMEDGKPFFAALLACHQQWDGFFSRGMRLEVNDPRARDEVRASLVRALAGYVDLHEKYGMGYYWGADDLHDGFPPTTLSLCTALLAWGHVEEAKAYLGYYLDHFVKPDGTLLYYGPAVAEYGELLELAVSVARHSDDAAWFDRHRDALEQMLGYLLSLRRKSLKETAPDAIAHGLLFGGAEADTRKETDYYFSGSAWCWRALLEMGRYYRERGNASQDKAMTKKGDDLLAEAKSLRQDIAGAVDRSTIRHDGETFIPPIAGYDTPFKRMTESRLANYTNYRYWPEALYAGCLTPESEKHIFDYRANHGGDLLGMTRFGKRVQHFDDWPFYQHAYGLLARDRVSRFLLGYYGHMAHHQTPGTLTSYEQVDLSGFCRRHDYADYCVPAQLTLPLLTRWMLVFEERDADTLWFLRATPKAWMRDRLAFHGASTRWGPVDLSAEPDEGLDVYRVQIRFARDRAGQWRLRLRHPEGRSLAKVDVDGGTLVTLEEDGQTMTIRPERNAIEVRARFAPQE